jgi:hypothetical protein
MLGAKKATLIPSLLTALIAWSAVGGEIAPALAQPPANHYAASDKIAQSQLRSSIASMTGLDPKSVEIHATSVVVSVRLINTLYNTGPASDREHLASAIAALIEKDSKVDPSLAKVVALHVQFLKRSAWRAKTIDTVEFRRDQAGALRRHRT